MKQHRRPRGFRALLLVASAALATAAFAAPAVAAPADGKIKLTFKAKAKSSLLRQGVTVDGGKGRVQSSELSVKQLWTGSPDRVKAGGAIVFAAGKRQAKLRGVQLTVRGRQLAVSAKLGKQRLVFFRAKGSGAADDAGLRFRGGGLKLTGKGAQLLRKRLGLDGGLAGKVGGVFARAALSEPVGPTPIPTPTPTPTPTPDPEPEPEAEAYPYEEQCPVPAVEGGEGFSDVPAEVEGIAPAPVFAAGTSQPVTGTSVDWGFKASFRSYVVFAPPAGTLQAVEGATANPSEELMSLPGSFFEFPLASGSYERGTEPDHSDDLLVAGSTGAALFCKPGHGFNVVLKNPTVTIDGADSRITAEVGVNLNGTWYPFQQADIADLDLSGIEPKVDDSGNTLTWEEVPATLTEDGEAATGGIYEAGAELDPITVTATLDRPLLAECAIEAGTATPEPEVEFSLAALPTLNEPEVGTGGTIDWGFRRASRNSVAMFGGSFPLLGGATEGYPGNMGGAAAPAPEGGLGKFFRFPVSEWEWEEGEPADASDDRLIATSEATVAFCLPAHTYALVISKPTLVLDGGQSRLVANAYSFQTAKGWIGGRVDLVALDATGVEAAAAGQTVSWGDVPADESPLEDGFAVSGGLLTNALALANLTEGSGEGGFDPLSAQIELVE